MIQPVTVPLTAYRWTPFLHIFEIEGVDLTGGTFRMQVRLKPDATGAALIDLTTTTPPAEGLSVAVAMVGAVPSSTITIRINETTLEGLMPFPNGTKPGEPVELCYDMHVTATGYPKARWLQGDFFIQPGATQA